MHHERTEIELKVEHLKLALGKAFSEWLQAGGDAVEQARLLTVYHQLIHQLYDLGWDDMLPIELELPYHLMPAIYLERNAPYISENWSGKPADTQPK